MVRILTLLLLPALLPLHLLLIRLIRQNENKTINVHKKKSMVWIVEHRQINTQLSINDDVCSFHCIAFLKHVPHVN